MKNIMDVDGVKGRYCLHPENGDEFRGEFVGRNGGADFYAHDVKELRREGAESLRVFLEECERHSVSPRKKNTKAISPYAWL